MDVNLPVEIALVEPHIALGTLSSFRSTLGHHFTAAGILA